jgi:hypothetical protein
MSRQHFTRGDVVRAIKSAQAAGVEVAVVEVRLADGVTIRICGPRGDCQQSLNPWDEVLEPDQTIHPPLDR